MALISPLLTSTGGTWPRRPTRTKGRCSAPLAAVSTATRETMACVPCATRTSSRDKTTMDESVQQVSRKEIPQSFPVSYWWSFSLSIKKDLLDQNIDTDSLTFDWVSTIAGVWDLLFHNEVSLQKNNWSLFESLMIATVTPDSDCNFRQCLVWVSDICHRLSIILSRYPIKRNVLKMEGKIKLAHSSQWEGRCLYEQQAQLQYNVFFL